MKKILIITPHLSTGGQPQYLLKKIEKLKHIYDFYVIEWENITGGVLVVQRNQIEKLLGHKFVSLGSDKMEVLKFINLFSPNVIHFEEIPETFISNGILDLIYNPNRQYYIVSTTHSSFTEPKEIRYSADKYVLVSEWSKNVFDSYYKGEIPCDVWEYPIEKITYDKTEAKKSIGFDPDFKHVLHVGLFTPGKNQKHIIDLAKLLLDYKIKFHFVGNQAINFESYWKPLRDNWPENCIWHDERSDVEKFYMASDLFYFPSNYELSPLALKEAISYGLPIFTKKLHTYLNMYDNYATYITENLENNKNLLLEKLYKKEKEYKIKSVHILIDTDSEREKKSIESVSQLSPEIEYVQCINKRYVGEEWKNHEPTGGWRNHGPGHWGCFDSAKKAILENFTEGIDALLYFEADCIIDVDKETFLKQISLALEFCDKHNLPYFSFGPRIVNGILESPTIKEDEEYPNFVITNSVIQIHCIIFTKKYKNYLIDKLNSGTWDSPDLWLNHVFGNLGMGIIKRPITHQEEGLSMLDETVKYAKNDFYKELVKTNEIEIVLNEDNLPILIMSTGRRLTYLKSTLSALFKFNKNIDKLFKDIWILDDRSSPEERFEMEKLFKFYFKDKYNTIFFNSNEPFYFVEKLKMIKKIIKPTDIIFFLEDDWECVFDLDLTYHVKNLINSTWTQIAFADPINIQEDVIKKTMSIGLDYWKNPFPQFFRHPVKYSNGFCFWDSVRINNFTLNPSLIKGEIFFEYDFKNIKNFEGDFADNTNTNQVYTQMAYFNHIGENSLINQL